MAFPLKQVYTIDDIYALPEGERAELIDGRMVLMAPPGTLHQRISHLLEWRIEDYIRRKKGDCQVFAAPFAVFLNDVTVRRILSLKSYQRAAAGRIMGKRTVFTQIPVCGNTGSWIPKNSARRFTATRKMPPR